MMFKVAMIGALLAIALATMSTASSQTLTEAKKWTPASISTSLYESSPTFTPDGKEMYFFRADRSFGNYRLLWSRCHEGAWSVPVPPSFAAEPPIIEADPAITADGQRLYYVSSRHRHVESKGGDLDIWYVERESHNRWSAPRRLPEPVNSIGSELLPRAMRDGRLIFGSNRPGGFGGGDIYIAAPLSNGRWSVRNFGPPVSTQAYEYEADVSQDGESLVLVVNRGARSHLYRFTLRGGKWVEVGRVPTREDVFQVGPLLSPDGDRLLFAQADESLSGELYLIDLEPSADATWPPRCE